MCGIVGYTGSNQATPILLEGLKKLEYRGYDSAGIAVRTPGGAHRVVKCKGKLNNLVQAIERDAPLSGTCGIGHTRWATHGVPSENNAHPHFNADESIVAVHNGIIENYGELKDKLLAKGYVFYSETDTEVATKLVDYYYKKWKSPLEAMVSFSFRARGSFALAVMFSDYPEEIYVARKDSPLIIGVAGGASYIASDVPAMLKYTRDVYYMGNMEIARVTKGDVAFYNLDRRELKREPVHVDWDVESAEKGGYAHFMMKEIHEQPDVIKKTFGAYVRGGDIAFPEAHADDGFLKSVTRVRIVACGSAYHAGVVAKGAIEGFAGVPAEAAYASEFRYSEPVFGENELVLLISQSGETADTLAALREAKSRGVKTVAVVNVVGSAIAREADGVIYTLAGPEISVATTKAYSAQLIVGYLFALKLAHTKGAIAKERYEELLSQLSSLPEKIEKLIVDDERIKWFASKISNLRDAFFIGRGTDYAACLEGSLKLKEVSYIHSEAYPAGELKHGTISLVEKGTLVVGLITDGRVAGKTFGNLREVKSRGAYIVCIAPEGDNFVEDVSDFTIYVPRTDAAFTASLSVIPMQLLSYYVSVYKGLDVDKPRNLAKCVTVE